jgi:ring-1,2-phenylacetyl-CoA epoxidase subunit PaaC
MKNELIKYCLRLGDNSLILSHRLSEYSSNGPFLEEDLALTNVSLDHLGQAEEWLKYVGDLEGKGKSADDLAYKRKEQEYFNCQLVEFPNTDFAYLSARQFFIDAFNYFLYSELIASKDETIAAIAAKSLKEVTYHLRRSSEWIIRLGDGTEESKEKIQAAIDDLWMYVGDLFETDDIENTLISEGIAANINKVKANWNERVNEILHLATLDRPENEYAVSGGKNGFHSEHMGYILNDMQYLVNAYPDAVW